MQLCSSFVFSAILLCFNLFYNYALLQVVLSFCSASIHSVIMLCFKSLYHSALLQVILPFFSASGRSVILLFFKSFHHLLLFSKFDLTLHIFSVSHYAYFQSHTVHPAIFPFLQFNSFFVQNDQSHTVCIFFFYAQFPQPLHFSSSSAKEICLSN
jgi:hypothetical protein